MFKKGGHGFTLQRCPRCISDILPLTFRVKYFKPKKNLFFKKGGLNIVGIFVVPLNALASPKRLGFFFSFLFLPILLNLSIHVNYASNLV